jgi:NADH:ubiquinone oxidoreductase subunit 6 (subunit J)
MVIPTEFLVAGGFYTFGLLAIVGALGVVLAHRVFHSALFLVMTLASVAAEFVILGADFLAMVEILVYVGAIMVLILFGIMLTPQQVHLPDIGSATRSVAAALVAGAIFVITAAVVVTSQWPRSVVTPMDVPTATIIGQQLFGPYVLPFELASVLLLIAMIGAIVIARED